MDAQVATGGAPVMPVVSKGALWGGRVMSALPVAMLAFSAFMKFTGPEQAVEGFIEFGYPEHLMITLGIVELACAVLYAIPQTAVLGAILVTGYLGGAVATHVRVEDPQFFPAVILGILVWGGLYLRDRRMRALIPLRKL